MNANRSHEISDRVILRLCGVSQISTDVRFDLSALMRKHGVTIRQLSERMDIAIKRVREVRAMTRLPYAIWCDWHQGVTGENVWSVARYQAMEKQLAAHRVMVAEILEREGPLLTRK